MHLPRTFEVPALQGGRCPPAGKVAKPSSTYPAEAHDEGEDEGDCHEVVEAGGAVDRTEALDQGGAGAGGAGAGREDGGVELADGVREKGRGGAACSTGARVGLQGEKGGGGRGGRGGGVICL